MCQESSRVTNDLIESWGEETTIHIENIVGSTLQIALAVLGSVAFGTPIQVSSDQKIPDGHNMSLAECLVLISETFTIHMALPQWVWGNAAEREVLASSGLAGAGWLGKRVQQISLAYEDMRVSPSLA